MKLDKGAMVASMIVIALASVFAGAGTMAYFSGVTVGSGSFSTGTLTLDIASYYGWTLDDKQPGDEWTTSITLENTGSLDAMYVYMGFDVTENADLADKIVLEKINEWCYRNGWATTTYDTSTANVFLAFWGAPQDGSISLWDLEYYGMPGGVSKRTSLKLHTGNPPDSGSYLPAGRSCIIELVFKLLENTGNTYQDKTCSFTITFIASNAADADIDASF
jgi:predicted ribosomally synthesized peptide with SipW-like signal peptide